MTGRVEDAARIMLTYDQINRQYGLPPEFYNLPNREAVSKRSGYPLRPEIVESMMYLYKASLYYKLGFLILLGNKVKNSMLK